MKTFKMAGVEHETKHRALLRTDNANDVPQISLPENFPQEMQTTYA